MLTYCQLIHFAPVQGNTILIVQQKSQSALNALENEMGVRKGEKRERERDRQADRQRRERNTHTHT